MKNVVIYIDVDLTLIDVNGQEIEGAVEMVKQLSKEDTRLYLWSTAGQEYCIKVSKRLGIYELFEGFGAKPDIVIDDMPKTCTEPFIFNPYDYEKLSDVAKNIINRHID